MQTPKEVIDTLLRKRPADRVGLHEYPWPYTLKSWVEQGYPADDKGEPENFEDHFKLDMVGVGGWINNFPQKEVYELVEENEEWHVHRDGWGARLKYWKNKYGTPEHVGFHMTTREIWEKEYRGRLLELDPTRLNIEGNKKELERRRAQGLWTHFGGVFIWETMRQSMGDMCLYESMVLDEDWIHDFSRVLTDFNKVHYRYLFEHAGKPDGIWVYEDIAYKHRLFCSPEQYSRLLFPYYREIVDFFHSFDLPVVLHACGFIEPALDLIVEAGFDALHPMEIKAGCDPLRIARQYKDKLALIGGLDAMVLETHDHALIRRKAIELVEGMKALGARYIFASDHSLSTNVRYDDYRVAVETYREHMHYRRRV